MTHDCGHAHLPNPHTDPARAAQYHNLVAQLFRMTVLTCLLSPQMAASTAGMVGMSVAPPNDPMPSLRALAWELADLMNVMFDGDEPQMAGHHCTNPDHDHDDTPPEEAFHVECLDTFFSNAAVGHLAEAVTVLDAVHREGGGGDQGDMAVVTFFSNAMVSAAFNARRQIPDPVSMFGEE